MANKFLISKAHDAFDLPIPSYMTELSAGMDLYANVHENIIISPGQIKLIPAGIKIALPVGFEAQTRPRSGLALKNGITILNSPGTIDADYRGEIKIILINFGDSDYVVKRGDRIAQMVINKVTQIQWELVDELPETVRGESGFGHTG